MKADIEIDQRRRLSAADRAALATALAAKAESSATRIVHPDLASAAIVAHRAASTAGYAISKSRSSATADSTFASPDFATVSPVAPYSICMRPSSIDLCVFVCGRSFSLYVLAYSIIRRRFRRTIDASTTIAGVRMASIVMRNLPRSIARVAKTVTYF